MHFRIRGLVALPLFTIFLGCGDFGRNPRPAWLRATVNQVTNPGSGVGDSYIYNGSGLFAVDRSPQTGSPTRFVLHSTEYTDGERRLFAFATRHIAGVPHLGVYNIATGSMFDPSLADFWGHYKRGVGDSEGGDGYRMEVYAPIEGSVEILSASSEAVEGTFRFTAAQVYLSVRVNSERQLLRDDDPDKPHPDAPQIHVTGSFRAIPHEQGMAVPVVGSQ